MCRAPWVLCLSALFALGVGSAAARAEQRAAAPGFKRIGFCFTGFGVPGSGRPYAFASHLLVNAGEGCPTLLDVSDPRRPKVERIIPTWFFTTHLYPLPSRDLVYLSNSRGPLLVLAGLKDLASRGDVRETPWKHPSGRAFLSALRPDGIGYTVADGAILVLDLNDPDHPKELARIEEPRLKGRSSSKDANPLTFSEDFQLAAAVVDGGKRVALLAWKSPTEPEPCGEFENASVTEAGNSAYGKVLALDRQRLVLGHPASTDKYWRSFRMTFWDVRDPRSPRRAAEMVFDHPGTHIRDLLLAGPHAYAIDGRDIASGHTVLRGQRSRLYVLDLADLASPKIAATCEETMPTEYSQLALQQKTLYVNDYNYGIWTFDVSDPPKPAKLGGVPVSAEGHWLYLHGDYAFVAHTFGGTIHVIDVADAARPRTVGYYWDGQWLNYQAKIVGRGTAMYLPQYDGLAIVDIARPSEPRRVGEFVDAEGRPLRQPCLDLADRHAFVAAAAAEKSPPRLLVYDLADPLKPHLVATGELPKAKGYRVRLAGKMLYLVAYGGGRVVAVDVADPVRPRVAADLSADKVQVGEKTFSMSIKDGGGNGAPGVAFFRGYLYVTMGGEAPEEPYLLLFDVRDASAIRPAGVLLVTDRKGWQYFACDAIIEGGRLYIGDYGCEETYDLADPLAPRRIAQYRRAYSWQVGTLRGRCLYVPKLDGLEILEVPPP